MSVSEATIDLTYRARNLADGATRDLQNGLRGVADTGAGAARTLGSAFNGIGNNLSIGLGMATETLATGGGLPEAAAVLGVFMAGNLVENMAGGIIEKIASSGVVAVVGGAFSTLGTTVGGLMAAAVPIGMAALPALLVAALVAVVAVLIANPDIRNRVIAFAQGIVGRIVDGLGALAKALPGLLVKAVELALKAVIELAKLYVKLFTTLWIDIPKALIGLGADIVRTIVRGLVGLPGAIANAIRNAFASLRIDVGPFHITGKGITVDLPKIDVPQIGIPGLASGVQNFAGGVAMVGERGPELVRLPRGSDVIPTDQLRGLSTSSRSSEYVAVAVSRRDIARVVDGELYLRLQRAAASLDRA